MDKTASISIVLGLKDFQAFVISSISISGMSTEAVRGCLSDLFSVLPRRIKKL